MSGRVRVRVRVRTSCGATGVGHVDAGDVCHLEVDLGRLGVL